MDNQVGLAVTREITSPSCAACEHWNGPNETYATCRALAAHRWVKKGLMPLPFWTPLSVIVRPDMTVRTLAIEGKTCSAYISTVAPATVE